MVNEKDLAAKERVKYLYSQDNVWYIDDSPEYNCFRREVLEFKRMAHPRKGRWLLEVGAGRGRVLCEFAGSFERIIAVDISEKMLRDLIAKCLEEQIKNIYLVQADAENLPFKDHIFDLVLAPEVIGHCPDISRLLFEIKRTMKAGTVAVLSTAGNLFSLPGMVGQLKSIRNCLRQYKLNINEYFSSPRRFWIARQGYCRDTYFSIRKAFNQTQLEIEEVSGAGILPSFLSARAKILENLSIFYPIKYFCRVILFSFRQKRP